MRQSNPEPKRETHSSQNKSDPHSNLKVRGKHVPQSPSEETINGFREAFFT